MKRLESPVPMSVFCVTGPEGDITLCLPLSHLSKVKIRPEKNLRKDLRKMMKADKRRN